MRAGACPVPQALTAEATAIVKQAIALAKRRGHAQVTPLHVANTMLSSSTGLLRTACMQSHSHPLQCKALELCFNVALNRLPASSSTPMLAPHNHQPLLSNALVAAFKRAQAHQRRGSIENQQQPLLAVKIEIEQLIISILDDPSVSRVMREAGFSSTQVKNNIEQAVSVEISASPSISKPKDSNSSAQFGVKIRQNQCTVVAGLDQIRNEDVASVLENLMNRRRKSIVIVGECLVSSESVVRGVMAKVDKGDVPDPLRNVQFITLPLYSFLHLCKEEVEQKLGKLRCLVKTCVGKGVVLYLGDLKWTVEYRASFSEQQVRKFYCPVEHVTMEIGRLMCGVGECGRLWLMGIATYQTYMRCRVGYPSLESIWGLHPLPIPAGSLGLSLNPDSDLQDQLRSKKCGDGSGWSQVDDTVEKLLACCADCLAKFKIEARSIANSTNQDSNLPSWLQQYKDETKRVTSNDPVRELCKKWNSVCNSLHKQQLQTEIALNFSSSSPSSSSSYDQHFHTMSQTHYSCPVIAAAPAKKHWKHQQIWIVDKESSIDDCFEPNLQIHVDPTREPKPALLTLSSYTKQNPNPNSVSSGDTMEMEIQRFKQFSAESLKSLCNALEQKVAWQKHIIPEIASTVLQCRSGMIRRKGVKVKETKEDTCLFFQGSDAQGKEKIARELANMVFGSEMSFVSINLSSYSSVTTDPNDELRGKRCRAESSSTYLEKFNDAISNNPHRVFFLEDIEQVDYYSQLGIKNAIGRGRIRDSASNEVQFWDAIIVLSCESFDSRSRACSPTVRKKSEMTRDDKDGESEEKEHNPCGSLDLNLSVEDTISIDDECSFDVELQGVVDRTFIFGVQEVS